MGILLGVILNPSLSGWTQRWFISHSCPGDSGFLQSVTWLLYLPRSSRSNQGGEVTGGHHGPVRWHMWQPLTSHWLELSHMITSNRKGGWETEFPGRRGHWCGDPLAAGCHCTQQLGERQNAFLVCKAKYKTIMDCISARLPRIWKKYLDLLYLWHWWITVISWAILESILDSLLQWLK